MQHNEGRVPAADADLAAEQGYQDGMIARRLPAWLRNLRVAESLPGRALLTREQLGKVLEALKRSFACRQRLDREMGRIQGIEQYCKPLLQRALQQDLYASLDVDALFLRHFYFTLSPAPELATGRMPQQEKNSYDIPLLDAALANFTEIQAHADGFPHGDCVVGHDGSQFTQMSATAFAKGCRQLNLGKRYQEHLASILDAPASPALDGHSVKSSLKELQVSSMLLDACKARSEGVLTADELALVFDLCRAGSPGTLEGCPVVARQLTVYGCKVEQVVVLDQITTTLGVTSSKRVLVHIPGDPVSPWSATADLDTFIRRTLGKRLGDASYQRFFARFIRRRDSSAFFTQVADQLMDVATWASRDMGQHTAAYPLPLFDHLAQARIDQIKDDAAVVAVPVQAIDGKASSERQDRLISAAWTVANVAGLFVPGIGAFLGAVMVWGMLKDVYHAVEDWGEGDTQAALDHLMNIAETVAMVGLTAAVFGAVARQWHLVDELATARLEDGSEKLWRFDLAPFRSASPPLQAQADAEGVYRLQGRSWVKMDGYFYEVIQRSDEQWQIVPMQGHGPQLRHNGAGAWRAWCEQPIEWDEPRSLFRRLGNEFSLLEDEQVDQVLAIHGLDASHLRGLHVCGQPPEACLIDTVSRIVLVNRIRALVSQLRVGGQVVDIALFARVRQWGVAASMTHARLADRVWLRRRSLLGQLYYEKYPVTADTQVLQRDFASLHRLAAEALLNSAGQGDLNPSAAALVRRIRCVRVYEALLFDTPQCLDLARVALKLLERLPGAANGPCWRLFDGELAEPLWRGQGLGRDLNLHFKGGEFYLSDERGAALGGPGELFQQLAKGYSHEQRETLGIGEPFALHLRSDMARRVAQRRQLIAELLDIRQPADTFKPPQRLANGRIGYPLSGWRQRAQGGVRNLAAELRDLYPGFDDAEVHHWLARLRAAQRDPATELLVLKGQLNALRKSLGTWKIATVKAWHWKARREFARGLIDCWRYLIPKQLGAVEEGAGFLLSTYNSDLDELPGIPANVSFSHVSEMALRSLQIRHVPERFLRAFSTLSTLSITNCRLGSLPLTAEIAQRLCVLDVSGNQIRLEAGAANLLASCRRLIYLNLSHNPLQHAFSITEMPGLNALMLRNAQLTDVPGGILHSSSLHTLDISENGIRTLPFGFYRSTLWRTGRVRLSGNPLLGARDVWNEALDDQVPTKQRWLDLVVQEQRDHMANVWGKLYGNRASKDFFHLLDRLTTSADFQNEILSRYLAMRVLRMLDYMHERPALQRELYEHALTEHCQDNATLRFSDLEVRARIWKALNRDLPGDQERALLHLGGQCWRLDVLDEVAGLHAIRVGRPDESLEFALAYRLQLADMLDLPIEHDEMLNAGVASLSREDLRAGENFVRHAQSRDALVDYLATTRFWKDYLAQKFPGRLRVPQSLHDEREALEERDAPEAEFNRLQDRVQQRELNVYRQLTRQALDGHLTAVMIAPATPWY
ncbi:NEL-type E3 ubiquitin ligase domain-containing protein [Pseudomonas sp. NPDC089392]|uniref:NEL-type E3 ubiquitin ligase domain-containing protein n=1 Tax=Pseudomonas sp. NPDC089392 TaxID=3364459 RepID=UPI0038154E72